MVLALVPSAEIVLRYFPRIREWAHEIILENTPDDLRGADSASPLIQTLETLKVPRGTL